MCSQYYHKSVILIQGWTWTAGPEWWRPWTKPLFFFGARKTPLILQPPLHTLLKSAGKFPLHLVCEIEAEGSSGHVLRLCRTSLSLIIVLLWWKEHIPDRDTQILEIICILVDSTFCSVQFPKPFRVWGTRWRSSSLRGHSPPPRTISTPWTFTPTG